MEATHQPLTETESQSTGHHYTGRGLELAAALLAADELNALAGQDKYQVSYEEAPPRYEIDLDRWDYADGPIPEHYLPSLTRCRIYVSNEASDDLSDFQSLWREKENQAFDILTEAYGTPSSLSPMPFESAADVIRRYLDQPAATRETWRELKKMVQDELMPIVLGRTEQAEPPLELLSRLGQLANSYVQAIEGDQEA